MKKHKGRPRKIPTKPVNLENKDLEPTENDILSEQNYYNHMDNDVFNHFSDNTPNYC